MAEIVIDFHKLINGTGLDGLALCGGGFGEADHGGFLGSGRRLIAESGVTGRRIQIPAEEVDIHDHSTAGAAFGGNDQTAGQGVGDREPEFGVGSELTFRPR